MKRLCILPLVGALAFFVSCQKQQTEEEKRVEVERQVQERLAVERQADEKQRLAQQQVDLEARERALAEKEAAATAANVPAEKTIEAPVETPDDALVEPPQTVPATREIETRSTASYGMFYRKLEPHGDWRETREYGFVWQPREAGDRTWRPYTDGRWVYTDAGWTWVSEEPFGWATYHYGRWVRLRRVGWVWVPGDEWAPAWVSWRTSKDYVGWAPLPPEARFDRRSGIRNWADNHYDIGPDQYAFVPNNEFGARRLRQSLVPVERNVTIVIETTNVTNITYANTTIVNHGPNYEEVRSRSRQPIERYRLERQVNSETTAPATVRGEVLVMSAPALTTDQGINRPQKIKENLTEATVEKSWASDADRPAADRARAKMKAESTPPPDAPSKTVVTPPRPSSTSTPVTTPAAPTDAGPIPTPKPAVSALPTSTPIARTTPAVVSTPAPSIAVSPKPVPTVTPPKTTPVAASTPTLPVTAAPKPAPTARATVPPISTPSVQASPSARPRQPAPPAKPSPAMIVPPPESAPATAPPRMVPAVPSASSTPDRGPQTTPRRILPTPLNTPAAARPSSTQPMENAEKPAPRYNPVPRPVASPRVPQPSPVVAPPAPAAPADALSRPPDAAKPVVPQAPSGIRLKPPAAPSASPTPK